MKYEAEIDGRAVTLELDEREGQVKARLDGREYQFALARPENGVYLFFAGDRVYEARVERLDEETSHVALRDRGFHVRLIDRKHRRGAADHGHEGQLQLLAPMPGKVVRVLRQIGDEVRPGEGVVVVEAMKMQNEVKSSKAGHVIDLRVTEGDTVTANQLLAVVE